LKDIICGSGENKKKIAIKIVIHITASAAREIERIKTIHRKQDSQFRLRVKQGGCSGFLYVFELDKSTKSDDRVFESNGIWIAIDETSYPYLEELKLDYSEDLMGGGFRFQNPKAVSSCGCGQSFQLS
jgi:iron-sulfur cluster assembly protein